MRPAPLIFLFGAGWPSSRKTDASFRIVQTRECNPLHSEHHIVNCPAVRPRFGVPDKSSTYGVLCYILPFIGIVLGGTEITVEIISLPDWWFKRQCCGNTPRTDAFPHLHPIGHRISIDFRPRE